MHPELSQVIPQPHHWSTGDLVPPKLLEKSAFGGSLEVFLHGIPGIPLHKEDFGRIVHQLPFYLMLHLPLDLDEVLFFTSYCSQWFLEKTSHWFQGFNLRLSRSWPVPQVNDGHEKKLKLREFVEEDVSFRWFLCVSLYSGLHSKPLLAIQTKRNQSGTPKSRRDGW